MSVSRYDAAYDHASAPSWTLLLKLHAMSAQDAARRPTIHRPGALHHCQVGFTQRSVAKDLPPQLKVFVHQQGKRQLILPPYRRPAHAGRTL